MQNLNRSTMKYAADMIKVGMKLPDIKALCENYLLENGADSFWYWDVGTFVLQEMKLLFPYQAEIIK